MHLRDFRQHLASLLGNLVARENYAINELPADIARNARPSVVISQISGDIDLQYGGQLGVEQSVFQIILANPDLSDLEGMIEAIEPLANYNGEMGRVRVSGVAIDSLVGTGFEPDINMFTYTVRYRIQSTPMRARATGEVPVTPSVPAPLNVAASAGTTSITISWTRPDDLPATARTFIRQGPFADNNVVYNSELAAATHTVASLLPGTYQFHVYFQDGSTRSAVRQVSATIAHQPPAPPTSFMASVSDNDVTLTWQRPAGLGTATTIIRRAGTVIYNSDASATTFMDNDLPRGQTFVYTIQFRQNNLDSTSLTTSIMVPFAALEAPVNLAAVASGNNRISISWQRPSSVPIDAVIRLVRDTTVLEDFEDGTEADTTTYQDTINYDDNEGRTITYSVSFQARGDTSPVATATVTITEIPPVPVTDFMATVVGTTVQLRWSKPAGAGRQSTYTITRDGTAIQSAIADTSAEGTQGQYNDVSRPRGTTPVYTIAYTENGVTAATASVSATIPHIAPNPLQSFTATAVGGSVLLQWTRGDADASVVIRRDGAVIQTITDASILQYTDTGRTEGTTYTYTATHVENNLASTARTASATIPFSPPSDPVTFTATVQGTQVRFDWTSADLPANTQAIIRQGDVFATATQIHSGPASAGEFTPTTSYMRGSTFTFYIFFRVNGLDSGHRVATATIPHTAPDAPTGFTAVATGNNQITLMWSRPASVATTAIVVIRRGTTDLEGIDDAEPASTTSYIDTINYDNNEGQEFTYSIFYRANNLNSAAVSASVTIPTTNPEPVNDFTATVSGTDIILTWSRPAGAGAQSSYTIRRGGSVIRNNIADGSVTYTDTNRPRGVQQSYTIAYMEDGVTAAVATAQATVPHIAPLAPVSLTASVNDDDITLTWSRPTGTTSAARATIRRAGSVIATNVAASTYTDTGLTRGSSYTYTVTLTENSLTGPAASVTSAVVPFIAPLAPASLSASVNDDDVTLTWTLPAGTTSAATATITRGGTEIATGVTGLSYTDNNVQRGVAHTYTVALTENSLTGPTRSVTTEVVMHIAPAVPRSFTSSALAGTITLNWQWALNLPTGTETIITRDTVNGAEIFRTSDQSVVSFADTGRTEGTAYTYVIRHRANNLNSPTLSTTRTAAIAPPDQPLTFTATANTAGQVTFSWTSQNLPANTMAVIRQGDTFSTSLPVVFQGDAATGTGVATPTYIPGTSYTFYLVFRVNGLSSGHRVAVATVPIPVPENFQASNITHNSLTLTWERPANLHASAQTIIRRTGVPDIVFTDATVSEEITGLEPETQYTFIILFTIGLASSALVTRIATTGIAPLFNDGDLVLLKSFDGPDELIHNGQPVEWLMPDNYRFQRIAWYGIEGDGSRFGGGDSYFSRSRANLYARDRSTTMDFMDNLPVLRSGTSPETNNIFNGRAGVFEVDGAWSSFRYNDLGSDTDFRVDIYGTRESGYINHLNPLDDDANIRFLEETDASLEPDALVRFFNNPPTGELVLPPGFEGTRIRVKQGGFTPTNFIRLTLLDGTTMDITASTTGEFIEQSFTAIESVSASAFFEVYMKVSTYTAITTGGSFIFAGARNMSGDHRNIGFAGTNVRIRAYPESPVSGTIVDFLIPSISTTMNLDYYEAGYSSATMNAVPFIRFYNEEEVTIFSSWDSIPETLPVVCDRFMWTGYAGSISPPSIHLRMDGTTRYSDRLLPNTILEVNDNFNQISIDTIQSGSGDFLFEHRATMRVYCFHAATVITPDAPTAFTATAAQRTITLTWTRPDGLADNVQTIITRGATNVYDSTTDATTTTDTVDYGTSYTYTILFRLDGEDSDTLMATVTTEVPQPNEITATLSGQQATLAWTNPDGLPTGTITTIDRPETDTNINSNILLTSYADPQVLPRGADYTWRIRYTINGVNGDYRTSNVLSVPFMAPDAPTGFMTTVSGNNVITLMWTRPASVPATATVIIRRDGVDLEGEGDNFPASMTSYTNTINYDDNEGTAYTYSIAFRENSINSEFVSSTVTIPTTDPEQVADFVATVSNTDVVLTWTTPTGAGAQATYTIRRGGVVIQNAITATAGAQTYTDTNRPRGEANNYEITYSEDGVTSPVATATATVPFIPPLAPVSLTASLSGADNVVLVWQVPTGSTAAATATVTRDGNQIATNVGGQTYTDVGVSTGATYQYGVSLTENALTGPPASVSINVPAVTTFPAGPVSLTDIPSRSVLSSGVRLLTDNTRPRNSGGVATPTEWGIGNLIGAQFRNNPAQTHFLMVSTSNPAAAALFDGTHQVRITMISNEGNVYYIQGSQFTFQSGTRVHEVVMASSTINVNGAATNLPAAITVMRAQTWGSTSIVRVEVIS